MINSINRSLVSGKKWYRNISAGNPLYSEMELIATAYGTGSSNSITFSSIPSGYKHLQIRGVARTSRAATSDSIGMRINSDTGTNYSYHLLRGTGSGVISAAQASGDFVAVADVSAASSTANAHGIWITDLLDVYSTSKNKTFRTLTGQTDNTTYVQIWSGAWLSTSAVSSITISAVGNFTTTSRFSLYGIKG